MATYAEERRARDAAKARRARKFRFEPVLFDRMNPPAKAIEPGTVVVKIQPPMTPRNGTMGMCYIGDPETGEFIGMVMLTSLVPVKRGA